jgi:hypothetical protein
MKKSFKSKLKIIVEFGHALSIIGIIVDRVGH